jgi:hypothetical protein
MDFKLEDIDLPKWPALVVIGKRVTKDQAMEIIVRTDHAISYPCCNDHEWEKIIPNVVGYPPDDWNVDKKETPEERKARWDKREKCLKELKFLDLEYLTNSRIASSYIGGPHGWCDWEGRIGCNSYNIGKWPSATTVFNEWTKIAGAFPFLELTSQLFNGEQGENGTKPVVEFSIKNGRVTAGPPVSMLGDPESIDPIRFAAVFTLPPSQRERGCTEEQLREAIALVRKNMKKKKG